jgi:RND family efflux transporter MFP subunit
MTMRTAIALVACTLTVVSGCRGAEEAPAEEIRPVRTITVEPRRAGETVSLTGTVQAETEVNYAFRIDGRLVQRSVNVGDDVRPGQLIAQLDPANEQTSLQAALAERDAARARAVEQSNNHARQKEMLAKGFISRAALDQSEAGLQSAAAALKSAQSQVEFAQNRVSYTRLVADAAGHVASVGAEPGEVVPAGRTVVQVARQGGRDAVFDVPARWRDTASPNPDITIALTSDPKVTRSSRAPRADQRGHYFIRAPSTMLAQQCQLPA